MSVLAWLFGAGIVLVLVSVGVVSFAVFVVSILIAYPGIYLFQKLGSVHKNKYSS
nr:hypothetical protein [Francisella tularensis]